MKRKEREEKWRGEARRERAARRALNRRKMERGVQGARRRRNREEPAGGERYEGSIGENAAGVGERRETSAIAALRRNDAITRAAG